MSNYCINIVNINCYSEELAKKLYSVLFNKDTEFLFKQFKIQEVDNSFLFALDMVNYLIRKDEIESLFNEELNKLNNDHKSIYDLLKHGYEIIDRGSDKFNSNDGLYDINNPSEILNYIIKKINECDHVLKKPTHQKKLHICRLFQKNPLSIFRNKKQMKYDFKTNINELDSSNHITNSLGSNYIDDIEAEINGDVININFTSSWEPLEGFFLLLTLYYPIDIDLIYYEDGCNAGLIEMKDGEYIKEERIQCEHWLELEILMRDLLEEEYCFDDDQVLEDLTIWMEETNDTKYDKVDFNFFGEDCIKEFLYDYCDFESKQNVKKYIKYLKDTKQLNKKIKIRRIN